MNTKEKFIKIFNENDILKVGRNSKITKELLIEALTRNYEDNIPLHITLGYCDRKAVSKGLSRAIQINKPSGYFWPKYLLSLYNIKQAKETVNKNQNITVSAIENRKEYDRQYYILNKGTKQVNNRKRKLAIKLRTPCWVDLEKMKEIYNECPSGYHVDHIIPLQGKLVSGLNIESNLQYLTKKENLAKSNKYIIK